MDNPEGAPYHEITSSSKKRTEHILQNNRTLAQNELHVGAHKNEVQLISIEFDGKGIFKPQLGEQSTLGREHTEPGTYYLREEASYLIDSALGFDLVPPTVIREINGKQGSLQQFIEDATPKVLYQGQLPEKDLTKMRILDYIIWNTDRNEANYLIKNDGTKCHAIDNGLAFAPENKDLVISFGIMSKIQITPEIADLLISFSSNPSKKEALRRTLEPRIGKDQTNACLSRIEKITQIAPTGQLTPKDIRELNYSPSITTPATAVA